MYVRTTGTPLDWTDPTTYDPDAFYTLEVGREKLAVGVSERLRRQVQRIVEDSGTPHYQVTSDFLRDAVVHLMHKRLDQLTDPLYRQELEAELLELRKQQATHSRLALYHRVDAESVALIELWERALDNEDEPDPDTLARTGEMLRQHRKVMKKDHYRQLRRLIAQVQLSPEHAAEHGIHLIDD